MLFVSPLPLHQLGLGPVGATQDCPVDKKGGDLEAMQQKATPSRGS